MGHEARWEYFRVIYQGYRKADRKGRQGMLNEFCLTSGYHRKYAIRLLNGPPPDSRRCDGREDASHATASRRFPS